MPENIIASYKDCQIYSFIGWYKKIWKDTVIRSNDCIRDGDDDLLSPQSLDL